MNKMKDLIRKFGNSQVLLVGDIMLDRFIYGTVQRISPEGPIPVLAIKNETEMLGGAGNVLANMRALGCQADIISVIGRDKAGDDIKALVAHYGAKTNGLIVDTQRPTILKTRYIAQNQQLLRVDYEDSARVSDKIEKKIFDCAKKLLKNKTMLVLSDYGKGVLSDDLTAALIDLAHQNNVTVIVDPKGVDFSKYRGADIVTPNKKELSDATKNMPVATDYEIEAAARVLINQSEIHTVLATRSEDGMSIITKDSAHHIPTKAREVFDVSGAGDTVVATLSTVLGAGGDIDAGAVLSNLAGGLAVAKIGTAIITATELENALDTPQAIDKEETDKDFIAPILDSATALQQIKTWQKQGLTVGFTNGCFDIIHYGHVSYLSHARQHCDRLVVGLNHDASVKILKGDDRPVNDEQARAHVIAGLAACDMVVFFGANKPDEDNTPSSLIGELQPDILFKGGDYKIDDLPEAKVVESYGGKVHIMNLYEGYSTTNIIQAVQK